MLEKDNFVSGEKIAGLCDVCIYDASYLKTYKNILRHTKKVIHNNSNVDVNLVNSSYSFFVKSDHISFFINKVLPLIKKNFILITHNADAVVGTNKEILNNPYLVKWYGQNIIPHVKTEGIPIGLENSQWKGWNYEVFLKYRNIPKTNLLYLNFSLKTNKNRKGVLDLFIKKGFKKNDNLPWEQYIKYLSSHKFAVCPLGNGPDTHRLWECIYLGVIPISEKHPCLYPHFNDLPVMWVDNFNDVNETRLNNFVLQNNNVEKSKLTYWMNKFSH